MLKQSFECMLLWGRMEKKVSFPSLVHSPHSLKNAPVLLVKFQVIFPKQRHFYYFFFWMKFLFWIFPFVWGGAREMLAEYLILLGRTSRLSSLGDRQKSCTGSWKRLWAIASNREHRWRQVAQDHASVDLCHYWGCWIWALTVTSVYFELHQHVLIGVLQTTQLLWIKTKR